MTPTSVRQNNLHNSQIWAGDSKHCDWLKNILWACPSDDILPNRAQNYKNAIECLCLKDKALNNAIECSCRPTTMPILVFIFKTSGNYFFRRRD